MLRFMVKDTGYWIAPERIDTLLNCLARETNIAESDGGHQASSGIVKRDASGWKVSLDAEVLNFTAKSRVRSCGRM